MKNRNNDFSINWEILARTKNNFNLKYGCTLCSMEKHDISKINSNLALNKRNELFSNCKNFLSFCFTNLVSLIFFNDLLSYITTLLVFCLISSTLCFMFQDINIINKLKSCSVLQNSETIVFVKRSVLLYLYIYRIKINKYHNYK